MKPGDLFRVTSRILGHETVTLGQHDLDAEEQEVAIGTLGLIVGQHDSGAGPPESFSVIVGGLVGWLYFNEIEVISETR